MTRTKERDKPAQVTFHLDELLELRGLVRRRELIAEQNQDGRGRENLRQGRGRRDRAGREPLVVAMTQHGRPNALASINAG